MLISVQFHPLFTVFTFTESHVNDTRLLVLTESAGSDGDDWFNYITLHFI